MVVSLYVFKDNVCLQQCAHIKRNERKVDLNDHDDDEVLNYECLLFVLCSEIHGAG